MKKDDFESDLIVLTADKNMKFSIEGLLRRPNELSIRPIKASFYIHPERDPGCLRRADTFLRSFANRFSHAIVIFDREGCGKERKTREQLAKDVILGLSRSGWGSRASAIVIDPELENWVFSDSPEVAGALGWQGKNPVLRSWLEGHQFLSVGQTKPSRPKEAMEAALRHVKMPRSSSIYAQLAERAAFERCTDPAFIEFKSTLQSWFPL